MGTEEGDHLEGTSGPDVIVGLGGADFIEGAGGDDTICAGDNVAAGARGAEAGVETTLLFGGRGDDRLFGRAGIDTHHAGRGWDQCGSPRIGAGCNR